MARKVRSDSVATTISVRGLEKRYQGLTAVENISFEVDEGEIFGILGPNGAGKTTTVECLQGLRSIDNGEVSVLGLDPTRDASALRQLIGSQLQESALPDRMKVWEALDLFASLRPGGTSWEQLLDSWGLGGKRDAKFAELSGGQRQRLFVALSLVNNPQLVFLDEMTTGLDPASRRVAWNLIRKIREQGTTVVLVTHFMDEAETLCDRLVLFNEGKIVAEGTPQRLIDEHAGEVRVRFTGPTSGLDWLREVPHVTTVLRDGSSYEIRGNGPVLAHIGAALVGRGLEPPDLRVERATLEDVFLLLTSGAKAQPG